MIGHLAKMILLCLVGFIIGQHVDTASLVASREYSHLVSALLIIGLYGSIYGIDIPQLKKNGVTVLLSVTVGVLLKVCFTLAVLYTFGMEFQYALILAIIVSQIDPLAVATLEGMFDKDLSSQSKSILHAWASFDDPMTVLLFFYIALPLLTQQTVTWSSYFFGLGTNLAFFVVMRGAMQLLPRNKHFLLVVLMLGGLIASGVIAVINQWFLGFTLIALILRPIKIRPGGSEFQPILDRCVKYAFDISLVIFGLFFQQFTGIVEGVILGIAAFVAQMLVANVIGYKLPLYDRMRISCAQYNGITSIVLVANLVAVWYPAVSIIAMAILTISICYIVANLLLDRYILGSNK